MTILLALLLLQGVPNPPVPPSVLWGALTGDGSVGSVSYTVKAAAGWQWRVCVEVLACGDLCNATGATYARYEEPYASDAQAGQATGTLAWMAVAPGQEWLALRAGQTPRKDKQPVTSGVWVYEVRMWLEYAWQGVQPWVRARYLATDLEGGILATPVQ